MTTNKPEIVAYHHESPEHRAVSLHHDASCTSTPIKTEPLIRLSDYQQLRAECEMLRNIINTLNGDNGERLTDLLEMNRRGGAVCKEYTLREVIGDAVLSDAVLSDWARWVTVDADGAVWEYAKKPAIANEMWTYSESDRLRYIGRVAPPLNFENCIWEIKNEK